MRSSSRALIKFSKKGTWKPNLFFPFSSSDHSPRNCYLTLLQSRSIFSTTQLHGSWMDKIKGVITGKKSPPEGTEVSSESFTLLRFADELKNARRVGAFKQYIVGRSSEATFADAFEKQEAIIRYLGGFDSTGEYSPLDRIPWSCEFARAIWSDFFQTFGFLLPHHKDTYDMIREFLHHPLLREKGRFLWLVGMCAILWGLGDREMIECL